MPNEPTPQTNSDPMRENPYRSPESVSPAGPRPPPLPLGHNDSALRASRLAFMGFLPYFGILPAGLAVYLGCQGLIFYLRYPDRGGLGSALTGLMLGGTLLLFWGLPMLASVFGYLTR